MFWIGAGWKMNLTRADARAYAERLRAGLRLNSARQVFVLPPFTALAEVAAILADAPVLVGAQNVHWAESGPWTGEISAPMLRDCGAAIAEIGHSERRTWFGETDATVNKRVRAALRHGLKPLICVGETERATGVAGIDVVCRQVARALEGVAEGDLGEVLLAYEPVWAIGDAGTPATPDHVSRMHAAIRDELASLYPGAARLPAVLYGGSVNLANAAELAKADHVDGLFIGRSAWTADGLLAIADAVARTERV